MSLIALGASSFHPGTWWGKLAAYFSLSSLTELYLSFLLMYHGALTLLLGAYGVLPPNSGVSHLGTSVVGLDLNSYLNPLVTANFGLPFYLGFVSLALITSSMIVNEVIEKRKTPGRRGVAAIFTTEPNGTTD